MSTKNFTPDFLSHYGIEKFFDKEKKGGQKSVYFVTRGGVKQVMKLFDSGKDDRFDREMDIYEKYKGMKGIPQIFEAGEYHGETIVFEEYIEGCTLSDITSNYTGNNDGIKKLMRDLYLILQPIWKGKYVHRDLKPENIIIMPNGDPVILDFGIARDLGGSTITATGLQPGSWKWAAPEQYAGKKDMISLRTDFFSLGVIAFFLFYGSLPFGSTIADISDKFKTNDESFLITPQCNFNDFLIESMRFRASHRPRSIEDMLKLI